MYNNHLENNTLELEIILDIILPSLTRWSSNKLDKTLAEQNPVARKTPVIMASFLWSDSWYPLRNNINWNNKTKNLLIDSVFNWHVIKPIHEIMSYWKLINDFNPSEHISNNHQDISDPGNMIQIFHTTGHNMKTIHSTRIRLLTTKHI